MGPIRPILAFACILVSATNLRAQPAPSSEPAAPAGANGASDAEYDKLVQKALAEYGRGNFPEARVFFARAHELRPSARTLRGLGLAAYEMRDYVEASHALRQALESHEKPLTAEMRTKAEQTLKEAEAFVAHYEVILEPETATLQVDSRAPVLREKRVLLNPGSHILTAEAANFEFLSRDVVVQGGERGTIRLVLRPLPEQAFPSAAAEVAPPPPPPPVPAAEQSSWNTQRSVAVGLGVGGLVAVGIGTTFGLMAASEKSKSEDGCEGNKCQPDGYEHLENANSHATVSTVSFVVSGALVAAGLVVYLTAPGPEARTVALTPAFAPGQAALSLSGRF